MASVLAKAAGVIAFNATTSGQTLEPPSTLSNLRPAVKIEGAEKNIIFGAEAPKDRYPYVASLQNAWGRHQCGGSLIAPDVVLTSAHCVFSFSEVHIGCQDFADDEGESERFGVEEQVIHPEYDFASYDHDLLLVKLTGASKIAPVMLNRFPIFPQEGFELSTVGWGRTDGNNPDSISDSLREARLVYTDNENCKEHWGEDIKDDMFCLIPNGAGVACTGDSGGPAVLRGATSESDLLAGVISWGPVDCNSAQQPIVNARITSTIKWIDSVLCEISDSPPDGVSCGSGTLEPAGDRTDPRTSTGSPTKSPTLINSESPSDTLEPSVAPTPLKSEYPTFAMSDSPTVSLGPTDAPTHKPRINAPRGGAGNRNRDWKRRFRSPRTYHE